MADFRVFPGQKTDRVSELGGAPRSRKRRRAAARKTRRSARPASRFEALERRLLLATVSLFATKDNTLYETTDGNLSNGAGDHFFVGLTTQDSLIRRSVIAFDVEGGGVPAGATVTDVRLDLTVSKSRLGTGDTDIALHELLKDWGEGATHAMGEEGAGIASQRRDATWVHTFWDTSMWDTAGGDFDPAVSATSTVGGIGTTASWSSPELVADVQGWVDDSSTNFGWILIGDETDSNTRRFWSKDSISGLNPRLEVTFTLETLELIVDDASISEANGQTMARVTRTNSDGDLTVALISDDTSEATVASTIMIPDGLMVSPDFPINAVDDSIVDGTQTVTLTATASGHVPGVAQLQVSDFEQLTVAIVDDAISENGGTSALLVTRTDTAGNLTVSLASDDATGATVPAQIVIPSGSATSTVVPITAVDDALLDGTQTVTISATAAGYVDGNDTLDVTDFEQLELVIAADSLAEGSSTTAFVRRTDPSGNLAVSLENSDASQATLPAFVLIPDGETDSATFNIDAIQDGTLDGTQVITISAQATGYQDATGTLAVTDFGPLVLTIADDTMSELDGFTTATVTRNNPTGELTVNLTTSDTSEALVQLGVTLADGQATSEPVPIVAVDDRVLDGTQVVTITAEADGYGAGSDTVRVTDYEELTMTIQAAAISENGGTTTATVRRPDSVGDLLVFLASEDPTSATVAGSVVIADGQLVSPAFTINAVDDAVLNGTRTISFVASAAGYVSSFDSLEITDFEQLAVSISATTISENGGVSAATVTRTDTSGELVVDLVSSNPARAAVVSSITIPDGAAESPPFEVTAVDDDILNGNQTVTISATAQGYVQASDTVVVTDFEQLVVLIADASISEKGGITTGTVVRSSSASALTVTLSSSQPDEATVPTTLTIPAGQLSRTFQITAQDDTLLDGPQLVTISAAANGYVAGTGSLEVSDFEELTVSIGASSIREARGTSTATVQRAGTSGILTVTLTSSDEGEATVPATVTIPNGVSLRSFLVRGVDDTEQDGNQTVTVTASAPGFIEGSDTVTVTDDETTTITLLPRRDATLYENATGAVANGSGDYLFAGRTQEPADSIRRGLLNFNLAQAGIPTGARIIDANLRMTVSQSTTAEDQSVELRQLTQDWGAGTSNAPGGEGNGAPAAAGDATWVHTFYPTAQWSNPGGDFSDVISATATVGGVGSTAVWSSAALVSDLQLWLESPSDNNGWILLGNENDAGSSKRFDSVNRSGNTPPILSITYAQPTQQLTLTPALRAISENGGTTQVTLSRSGGTTGEITVFLSSDDTSELTVPNSVILPDGAASTTFVATAVDDMELDGTIRANLQAVATGFQPGTTFIDVQDFEPLVLTVDTNVIIEGGNAATATVTRIGSSNPLTVSLLSDDVTEVTVPASITIPAGQLTSSPFFIRPVNDFLLDGSQIVTVTASAIGYASSSVAIEVEDDDTTPVRIAGGVLTVAGTGRNDNLTVRSTASDLVLIDPLNRLATSSVVDHEVTVPLTDFPGGVQVLAAEGANSLTFDGIDPAVAAVISFTGGSGTDRITVLGDGLSLDAAQFTNVDQIDLAGSGDNSLSLTLDGVLQNIDFAGDGLIIRSNIGDSITFDSGWTLVSTSLVGNQFFRILRQGNAQVFLNGPAHWQNPINRFDVNNDGVVSAAGDVLPSVNELNFASVIDSRGRLPAPPDSTMLRSIGPFYDNDGDGFLSPRDILALVNFLNSQSPGGEGEGSVGHVPSGLAPTSLIAPPVVSLSAAEAIDSVPLLDLAIAAADDRYYGAAAVESLEIAVDEAMAELEWDELNWDVD